MEKMNLTSLEVLPIPCLAFVPVTGAAFSVACLGVYWWGFNLGRSLDHLHDINHAFVCLVPTLTPYRSY